MEEKVSVIYTTKNGKKSLILKTMINIKISVHPVSHRLEWRDVSSHTPSHRAGLHRLPLPRSSRPQLSVVGSEAQSHRRGGG